MNDDELREHIKTLSAGTAELATIVKALLKAQSATTDFAVKSASSASMALFLLRYNLQRDDAAYKIAKRYEEELDQAVSTFLAEMKNVTGNEGE